ncbi:zinc finger protein 771-like isoform X1 [Hylaeus anthracinus]|uniref:zinc finger protein 771-like isoform X1 n=1 Tax=Hylaeus anthracinus TaxID=313031 RepID=UPI0023B99AF7|nr:zinc finger protein 771-like isoform X1 [Hylaeus anthracinus]
MINRGTIEIGSTLSSRRSSAIYQVSGFYAAAPQLDLNFVLQSCKAFESDANNREAGSEGDSGGASIPRSLPNYYSQDRVRNAYAKGSFADCFRKPFGCPKCGRCFTVKGNMTRHLKYECGQAPRFQCPYCEFRSKQTSNVMSHIRTRHTGQRVYVVHLKYEN